MTSYQFDLLIFRKDDLTREKEMHMDRIKEITDELAEINQKLENEKDKK